MSSSSSSTVNHANEACLASTTEMCLKVSDMDLCVGRLEAAVASRESTNPTPTNSSAVLEYAQKVRQVFDNMKGTIVDPLTGLTQILSEPDQPTTDTKFKCIQPHCKFLTSSSIDMEKHDQQVHQQNPKNELEPIENDGQIGDGSPSASTSTPPPTPPPSSSTASPENNVQNGDDHRDDGSGATIRAVQPLLVQAFPEQNNDPEPEIANNPGPKDNENGTVRVANERGSGGQGDASGDGDRGPEMDVIEVVVPERIQVDDNMYIVNQNPVDAGADVVIAAVDDVAADVAVGDGQEAVGDGQEDLVRGEFEEQEAVPIEQNPKRNRKQHHLFQLIKDKTDVYFPAHKKSKPEPKLVLKRGNPLFSLIMGTLQQSEAETLQISAAELDQILGNRRFQKMTIGFSARRD